MFDHADDALFALAEKTQASDDSTAYFDSMRIIRLKRTEIENQHYSFIEQSFANIKSHNTDTQKVEKSFDSLSIDDLSLIEEADLEENIAIKNIVSKVSHHCTQELSHIEKRLSHILDADINAQNNPLGPVVICNTFMQAATALDIELKVSLIILKLFDQEIVLGMKPLLDEANSLLINANVLPEFKHSVKKSEHIDRPDHYQTAEHQDNLNEQQTMTSDNSHFQNVNAIPQQGGYQDTSISHFHELLSTRHAVTQQTSPANVASLNNVHPFTPPQGNSGYAAQAVNETTNSTATNINPAMVNSANVVSSPQFVGSLSTLQNIPLPSVIPASSISTDENGSEIENVNLQASSNLKQFVIQQLQQQDANFSYNNISPIDQDVIDVISLLFDFILEDKNIPDTAKAHIARLQIPLLKAAIIDKEFFSANKNSARLLLNELAHAAIGIIDEDHDSSISLLAEIKRVVDSINENFEDDLSLFETELNQFNDFMSQHEHQEATVKNKIERKIKRKEDNALAYQWVEDTINDIMKDKHLPDIIIDLIRGPWKKVMLNTYLNNGQNSDTWKNQVRFIDVLEWSIQPKHESIDRQKLANIIGQLVLTLRNGLQVIETSSEEVQSILTKLEPFHLASIKGLSVREYAASLKPDTAFLFNAETTAQTNTTDNVTNLSVDSEIQPTLDQEDITEIDIQAPETVTLTNDEGSSESLDEDKAYLSSSNISLEEIDYVADEDYVTNLSLDEIDQTIQKMEQELHNLEELTTSLSNPLPPSQPLNPVDDDNAAETTTAEQLMEDEFILLGDHDVILDESEDDTSFNKLITEDIILSGFTAMNDEAPEDQPQDEYLELAKHLEQGKWVEFIDDNQQKTRAKLAWKSDLLGEYTFLNWKFDVVADKTLYGLAADLRRGSATIIDDIPLVDRALSAVMSSLTPTGTSS